MFGKRNNKASGPKLKRSQRANIGSNAGEVTSLAPYVIQTSILKVTMGTINDQYPITVKYDHWYLWNMMQSKYQWKDNEMRTTLSLMKWWYESNMGDDIHINFPIGVTEDRVHNGIKGYKSLDLDDKIVSVFAVNFLDSTRDDHGNLVGHYVLLHFQKDIEDITLYCTQADYTTSRKVSSLAPTYFDHFGWYLETPDGKKITVTAIKYERGVKCTCWYVNLGDKADILCGPYVLYHLYCHL